MTAETIPTKRTVATFLVKIGNSNAKTDAFTVGGCVTAKKTVLTVRTRQNARPVS